MDLKLKGKVAMVTGAGSQIGYGKSIAAVLAAEGCDLIIADINNKGLDLTAAEMKAKGYNVLALKADVTNRTEVDKMVRDSLMKFGRIDILVNNAGASNKMMPFLSMTRKEWDFDIQVNLYGQMNVAQAVLPSMIERKSGRIINTSGGQGISNLSLNCCIVRLNFC